jgi:hypothetical protein
VDGRSLIASKILAGIEMDSATAATGAVKRSLRIDPEITNRKLIMKKFRL